MKLNKLKVTSKKSKIAGVDLFCGVGGLTHGLARGGIYIGAGIDIDSNCQFPYERNNKSTFIEKDLTRLLPEDVHPHLEAGEFSLIAGCAPCQPFSTYSQKCQSDPSDGRWNLLLEFGRLIQHIQPDLVTMENVPQLTKHEVFSDFLKSLANYHVWYDVVQCVEYGVPQTRKRLVLLASKLGPIKLIPPTHSVSGPLTVRDAIADLPKIAAGKSSPSDPLHTACALSATNLRRIKASKPGGSWRDWPPALRAKCHTKESGQTYPSVYGRMEWDAPSPTITTQCFGFGNGRFGHPEQDRAISLREAASIQTFPKSYQFISKDAPVRFSVLGRLIGNAVPVRIGEVIGLSLMKHVKSFEQSEPKGAASQ